MTIGQRRRGVGVEVLPDGSVHARVWAPYARSVAVVFEDGVGDSSRTGGADRGGARVLLGLPARGRTGHAVPAAARRRQTLVADPASRLQPEGVYGPSMVVDPAAFAWEVDAWQVPAFRDWVLYELHVGTFTPEGTFAAAIRRLPYLKDLGVTAIELMPIAQFPGERNWGYDGVFPYAAQNSYGGPDGLRRLVDAAHREGIAVILDVVYNHLGPEGNCPPPRSAPTSPTATARPGATPSISTVQDSDEVRAFFIDSALMWLEECRIDGFRLDAIHEIFDPQAQPFLAELADAVHARAAAAGAAGLPHRRERSQRLQGGPPPDVNGYGLDAQWADDFCHALEVQLVGQASPYAEEYGDVRPVWTRRCARPSSTRASTTHPGGGALDAHRSRRGAISSSSSSRTTIRSATVPVASGSVTASHSRGRSSPRRPSSSPRSSP